MTRLYEALTRRSRSAGEFGGVNWSELAAAEEAARAAAPAPEAPAADGSSFGNTVAAAVSAQARLLPSATDPIVVEHYRRLRTKILQQREARPVRTLMVTSAGPQEGKTLTTLNLALSFALLPSFRVLVVEGDLRKGAMGEWLGVETGLRGFGNLIEGSATLAQAVLKADGIPLHFMMRGNSPISPAELLNAPGLDRHFAEMAARFDLVLVDSPPANLFTDAQLLAAHTDAVLVVARAFSTRAQAFERAVEELGPAKVIGAVLNAGPVPHSRRYAYEHYYRETV
jgi:capsular exopolysaccharide synthesis family protein